MNDAVRKGATGLALGVENVTPFSALANKHILLGVTGSIAAYKAATIASRLTQLGAQVDVILTHSAIRFVPPLTFQALTGRPVYTSMWESGSGGMETHIAHVGLAHGADLLLIAPITAHSIARLALGLADDLLTVTALAARCPILISPAMDAGMYENPATQAHIVTLRARGVHVAGPRMGRMASGLEGLGRFLEPDEIIGHCRRVLGQHSGALAGRRVVVSAGPTREALDPVRFLSNRSSGKQGFAIAQAAIDAGAEVTLIAGPVALPTPVGVRRIDVERAQAMLEAILDQTSDNRQTDALIMAAAVADFRPAQKVAEKIKKTDEGFSDSIPLVATQDILLELSRQAKRPLVTVGFAAESQDLIQNAQDKLKRKKLDLIVANDISAPDAGFAVETNRAHFVTAGEESKRIPFHTAFERILDHFRRDGKLFIIGYSFRRHQICVPAVENP